MSTSLPVSYVHTIDYFTKGIDAQGPFYRVGYKIDNWADTDRVCNALMGNAIRNGTVFRAVPHQHPLSPNLYCVSAAVTEGHGQPVLSPSGYPNYSGGATIQAEYRPPSFDFGPADINNSFDPATPILWCTQELDFATETYTIADAKYNFTNTPQTVDVPVKIQIPITTLTLTFHQLPYMPMTVVRQLRGRVNSATFLGAPAGTVLFKGARTTRQWNSDGSAVQEVQMTFSERDPLYPWNSLPNSKSLAWNPVEDPQGNTMYPTADLTPLVQL